MEKKGNNNRKKHLTRVVPFHCGELAYTVFHRKSLGGLSAISKCPITEKPFKNSRKQEPKQTLKRKLPKIHDKNLPPQEVPAFDPANRKLSSPSSSHSAELQISSPPP